MLTTATRAKLSTAHRARGRSSCGQRYSHIPLAAQLIRHLRPQSDLMNRSTYPRYHSPFLKQNHHLVGILRRLTATSAERWFCQRLLKETGGLCIPCATKSGSDAAYSSTLQTHEPKQLLAEQEDPSPYSGHRQHTSGISEYQGKIIVLLLAIGLGAPLVGWLKPIPKWEYKVIAPADSQLDETMQKMGADGWELVSTRRAGSQYSMSYEMILKRPKRW